MTVKSRAEVLDLLQQYVPQAQATFGDELISAILFGSYARGDYGEYSDIDVMLLLDTPKGKRRKKYRSFMDFTFDFNHNNNVNVSPCSQNALFFKSLENIEPFFRNIRDEGIILYNNPRRQIIPRRRSEKNICKKPCCVGWIARKCG